MRINMEIIIKEYKGFQRFRKQMLSTKYELAYGYRANLSELWMTHKNNVNNVYCYGPNLLKSNVKIIWTFVNNRD